jgi:hypothetical protein
MAPEGRMVVSAVLGLFFFGFAFGSLHTARQEHRWLHASVVHGVLVKHGADLHYEYRRPAQASVSGPTFHDDAITGNDGVVNDWVDLQYDEQLPEKLRRDNSAHNFRTARQRFLFTVSVGSVFALAVALCFWKFLQALYDKTQAD